MFFSMLSKLESAGQGLMVVTVEIMQTLPRSFVGIGKSSEVLVGTTW